MSAFKYLLGFQGYMALNTGTYAVPVWAELDTVGNMNLVVEGTEADVSMRRSKGWKSTIVSLMNSPMEIESVYEQGNANQDKIRDAFFDRTTLDILILDGPLVAPTGGTASEGRRAIYSVTKWSLTQEIEGAQKMLFSIANAPHLAGEEPKDFTGTVAA